LWVAKKTVDLIAEHSCDASNCLWGYATISRLWPEAVRSLVVVKWLSGTLPANEHDVQLLAVRRYRPEHYRRNSRDTSTRRRFVCGPRTSCQVPTYPCAHPRMAPSWHVRPLIYACDISVVRQRTTQSHRHLRARPIARL